MTDHLSFLLMASLGFFDPYWALVRYCVGLPPYFLLSYMMPPISLPHSWECRGHGIIAGLAGSGHEFSSVKLRLE